MRTIKFRGARMSDGATIYGYYHVRAGDAYIDDWRVKPETVAQFVGFDANGDEVYEGDLVATDDGDEYEADLFESVWDDYDNLKSFDTEKGWFTLKK